MKKILQILTLLIISVSNTDAQSHHVNFSIGPEYSLPTFSGISSCGIGAGISIEHFFNKRVEGVVAVSYGYFKGDVFDFYKNDTIKGFAVMPVLLGIKYFVSDKFYVSGAAGMVVGVHNAGNHLALSPGIGFLIPFSPHSKIDAGVKLIGIPRGYSFSENSFLNKGGYSYLTFKIAYIF
ncbi:MAG: hypothetical protein ABI091_09655 [Ferruginibacter sp.]